jgi:hypothetical protein
VAESRETENWRFPFTTLPTINHQGIIMNRIGKWWNSVSRFIWSALGMLWAIYGIRLLTLNSGNVLGYIAIGAGITIAIISLTTKKCPTCSAPSPFERIWVSVYEHEQFACHVCGARYRMPVWSRIFFYTILLGWFLVFIASVFNWVTLDILTVGVDGIILGNALLLVLVRFSRYERQDKV